MYPAIFTFDVDDTLAFQNAPYPGPVTLNSVLELRQQGIPTGICGNFLNLFKYLPEWWKYFSWFGPAELTGTSLMAHHQYKHYELMRIAKSMKASRYVMVGNKRGDPKARPGSQDDVQAKLAHWYFLTETEFAQGKR
jgi:hypothetical protein